MNDAIKNDSAVSLSTKITNFAQELYNQLNGCNQGEEKDRKNSK